MNQLLVVIFLCSVIYDANSVDPVQVQVYGRGEPDEILLYEGVTTDIYNVDMERDAAYLEFPMGQEPIYRYTKIKISNYGTEWLSIGKNGGLCTSKVISVYAFYKRPPVEEYWNVPIVNLHYQVWGKYVGTSSISECYAAGDNDYYYDDY